MSKASTKAKLAGELRKSIRKERSQKLAGAKGAARATRVAAVTTCKTEKQIAKEKCARARVPAVEARAERERIARENRELRKAEAPRKGLRPLKKTSAESRAESDDEVRANLAATFPEYIAPFNRIRQSVKASPGRSRTEAAIELIEADDDLMRQAQEAQFEAGERMARSRYGNPKKWSAKRVAKPSKKKSAPRKPKPKKKNPTKSNGRDALPKEKRAAFKGFHWGNESTKEQSVPVPDPRGAELYALGEIVEIVYETKKGKERAEYVHKTRARPLLMADAKDPHAFFIGVSSMENTTRGIVG